MTSSNKHVHIACICSITVILGERDILSNSFDRTDTVFLLYQVMAVTSLRFMPVSYCWLRGSAFIFLSKLRIPQVIKH